MPGLKIAYRDPALLKPRARNPRTHTPKKQIKQIAASIEQFGFVSPVLVDAKSGISAATEIGLTDLPCVRLSQQSLSTT